MERHTTFALGGKRPDYRVGTVELTTPPDPLINHHVLTSEDPAVWFVVVTGMLFSWLWHRGKK